MSSTRRSWLSSFTAKAPLSPSSPRLSDGLSARLSMATDRSPPPLPWGGSTASVGADGQALRKRVNGAAAAEDFVAALLPKMKRMRLRPSLGQLRLQREAEDTKNLSSQVRLCVEPELLRAVVTFEGLALAEDAVQLEISFPPQYPHRPPQIAQVSPERHLSAWRYAGCLILLPRLTDSHWSSAMGVADIVRDLLDCLRRHAREAGSEALCADMLPGCEEVFGNSRFPPVPVPSLDDVEMA